MDLNNNDYITIGDKKDSNVNIIWFHGYGSNNWSFEPTMKLVNMRLNEEMHIIIPNAPSVDNKRSWYPLPTTNNKGKLKEDYNGLTNSINAIDNFIELLNLEKNKKLIVGGFSQGAALSLSLLFKSKHKIDGCIALSGYMPSANDFESQQLKSHEIFIAHGYEDKAISYQDFQKTLEFLEKKSKRIVKNVGSFGHTITHEVTDDFIEWLRKI
ncbi:MAG: hypothetical protein HOI56_04825 [Gammaproteobacteria bacterium]|jgi:phospholipase/carboxylesterase|nr:hypothetical protein [Gammaproteobacteria bacterium]MBT4462304.1 hypothetical protein [Gammaproteobacteria bacterium]MBT4655231.1 hypothetical protein [Gammaproteobacteria bacterium]MBT5117014.1 hypothetical protein [Gammaproteobacteria bacterium]MBT5762046.1 hypothetical protein [Gammaproteobacteria bacterium]